MTATTVLICEAGGDWAALLRRDISGGATVIEVGQLDELWTRLRETPRAVVAMELRSKSGWELLGTLRRLNREFPQALAVVLVQRHLRDWEDICREAGAVAFIASPRSIGDLVEIVRGRVRSGSDWIAGDEVPLEDRILADLPWGSSNHNITSWQLLNHPQSSRH